VSDLRTRLRAGEAVVGSFVSLGSPVATEIMGAAGFDWLVIDLEHGAGGEQALLAQLMALAHTDTTAIVRVESIDQIRVLHALDAGADGLLVPRLRSADDARRAISYCRYDGARGVARATRAWHWGRRAATLADIDAEVFCAVQIETADALASVRDIAAVDGVDVLFVGPADLANSLGLDCGPADPPMLADAATVAAAAAEHGKAAGILVGAVDEAGRYAELGFTMLGIGADGALLAEAASAVAAGLRGLSA